MDTTLIAVVELSLSSWLVTGIVPGVERQPLKKLKTDENAFLTLLNRWLEEAVKSGHKISRIAVAFEAGRHGFWLARWLKARGSEVHVIHASSAAVSRENRWAKTDRLDTELLKRAFVGGCEASVITARWLPFRPAINIVGGDINEVLFAEAASSLGTRGHRLRQRHRDVGSSQVMNSAPS
jgi:hypothetical protein